MPNKKSKKHNPNGAGRKLFDGKDEQIVIQKLTEVWAYGGTDAEAALYSGISKAALSDYLKKHEELLNRKELLQETPVLKARKSVVDKLDLDGDLALKFLERKRKDEFSTKTEIDYGFKKETLDQIAKSTQEIAKSINVPKRSDNPTGKKQI